jgi:hypothetical protein
LGTISLIPITKSTSDDVSASSGRVQRRFVIFFQKLTHNPQKTRSGPPRELDPNSNW